MRFWPKFSENHTAVNLRKISRDLVSSIAIPHLPPQIFLKCRSPHVGQGLEVNGLLLRLVDTTLFRFFFFLVQFSVCLARCFQLCSTITTFIVRCIFNYEMSQLMYTCNSDHTCFFHFISCFLVGSFLPSPVLTLGFIDVRLCCGTGGRRDL